MKEKIKTAFLVLVLLFLAFYPLIACFLCRLLGCDMG